MKYLIGLVAAVILAGAGYAFINPSTPEDGGNIGSASSASIVGNCETINNNVTCYERQVMRNASTTCSFKAPTTASSTLIFAGATFNSTNAGSFDVEWGKDKTSPNATTTTLGYKPSAIASGDTGTFIATSSGATIEDNSTIIAPGSFVNFKIGSTSVSNIKGTCSAIFQLI